MTTQQERTHPTRTELLLLSLDKATLYTGSEKTFRMWILAQAKWTFPGWDIYYARDSRRSTSCGFPDLTMRFGGFLEGQPVARVLFRELKKEGGYPTPEQRSWLASLTESGCDASVWRPRDYDEILWTLAHPELSYSLVTTKTATPKRKQQNTTMTTNRKNTKQKKDSA